MSKSGPETAAITARYRAFAAEARGRSPRYEELAMAAGRDQLVLAFLATLPPAKRQPNLLFAAARYLLGEPADLAALHTLVTGRRDELARVMLHRRTQTNEPARCATLLPALALLPGPLALIEVGASAGLTLLVDRYSYDYAGHRVPDVVWRAGLDLNPLDVTSADDVRWLECLLWPGESGRQERLTAAIDTARRDPPRVHRGDLLTDLPGLASQAPPGATLVVYHSAVLAYVAPGQRGEFAELVRALGAVWLSNEAPKVLPGTAVDREEGHFTLAQNGTRAIAHTDPHGTWLRWLS
jgi:hypothetical protein